MHCDYLSRVRIDASKHQDIPLITTILFLFYCVNILMIFVLQHCFR